MNVMLLSEAQLKADTLINNNVDANYIYPSVIQAQDIGLQPIIGTCLYKKLISIVSYLFPDALNKKLSVIYNKITGDNVPDNIYRDPLTNKLETILNQLTGESFEPEEFIDYFILLDDYIVPYLEMQVMADIQIPLSYKVANLGVYSNTDENIQVPSMKDLQYVIQYYKDKANFYSNRLTEYLKANRDKYPEYKECGCACNDGGMRPSNNYPVNIVL